MSNKPTQSRIKAIGGVPTLFVNGEAFGAAAYMTYLEKYNEYADFTAAGCRLFSVPVLFAGRWISITDGFRPFKKGIFDDKGSPDFSVYDEAINKILEKCPEAYIIPRVNVTLPLWWEAENPEELNITPEGRTKRESLFSEKRKQTAEKLLREFLAYSESADFAGHIIGYQLAGGNTEEWFHYDLNAGYCKTAEKPFKKFLKKYYPDVKFSGLPDISLLNAGGDFHGSDYLAHYLEFASFAVAQDIISLAAAAKDETRGRVVIGTFYGYSLEVTSPLHGTHALKMLLDDNNIDFICSPNSYIDTRGAGCDWTEMFAADSVRLHGKMCFQECDIRTHLTVTLNEKDDYYDPLNILNNPIWLGPKTKKEAQNMIKKSFSRQLIKGNGLWWFDMWGGWYHNSDIMSDMKRYFELYTESLGCNRRGSIAELALIIDEGTYKYHTDCALRNAVYTFRIDMGKCGAMYDTFDAFDFDLIKNRYKAFIFTGCEQSAATANAIDYCRNNGIAFIAFSGEKFTFTPGELRDFCKKSGIFVHSETDDIIHISNCFISITAVSNGKKVVKFKSIRKITELLSDGEAAIFGDKIEKEMHRGETALFRLD